MADEIDVYGDSAFQRAKAPRVFAGVIALFLATVGMLVLLPLPLPLYSCSLLGTLFLLIPAYAMFSGRLGSSAWISVVGILFAFVGYSVSLAICLILAEFKIGIIIAKGGPWNHGAAVMAGTLLLGSILTIARFVFFQVPYEPSARLISVARHQASWILLSALVWSMYLEMTPDRLHGGPDGIALMRRIGAILLTFMVRVSWSHRFFEATAPTNAAESNAAGL